jgi:hypothetical protein
MSSLTYSSSNNTVGIQITSQMIQAKGANCAYSVLAHQVDWRNTEFGGYPISNDTTGTNPSEQLLNTIESYIYDKGTNNHSSTSSTYTTIGTTYQLLMNTYLNSLGVMSYTVMDIWGEL